MNEWLPGGNYSCPGTPNPNGRSLRFQQDESGRGIKPLVVNKRVLPESKSRNFLPHSMEDISKGFSSKKSNFNGTSDPRFKRVVPLGVQNDACVGTEAKVLKPKLVLEEKGNPLYKFSILDAPEFKPNKTLVDCVKTLEQSKLKANEEQEHESLNTAQDSNFSQSQDNLKAVDNLSFNHDIAMNSCKESASECTVNTRNTSLVSDELNQEIPSTLARVPSSTRVVNIENWIHEQGRKLGRKHSVITVIGQIQEPDALSSALQEIDKRRKLVKELDRYAVCKRIIETDQEKEISNLMEKISLLNNNESALFCGSNETLSTNSHNVHRKTCGNHLSGISSTENTVCHSNDDSSITDSRKGSFFKRNLKEFQRGNCYPVKGKLQMVFGNFPYQWVFCILIVISGVLFWFTFFSIHKSVYESFDLFNSKPKPISWYERICNWLWEFFRPSNNYHRTSQWRSY